MNGVARRLGGPGRQARAAKPVTESKDRPIPGHFWSGNGEQILFVQDKAGDENFPPRRGRQQRPSSATSPPSTRCACA
ncbi:MAG: hypothetical protein U1E77_13545 [Inhella sp.]